jgi:hypothetical protein
MMFTYRKNCYAPIDERDRMRNDYLNNKIWKNNIIYMYMLRLNKASFFQFCKLFKDRCLLQDTICIKQQVAMFMNTISHNVSNRLEVQVDIREHEGVDSAGHRHQVGLPNLN